MSLASNRVVEKSTSLVSISDIEIADDLLTLKYQKKLVYDSTFTRQLVSFQSSKKESRYRWYKFKEGFSSALVKHFLSKYRHGDGKVLDPFAGSGTTLFAASEFGRESIGIELLPIGQEIIGTKL